MEGYSEMARDLEGDVKDSLGDPWPIDKLSSDSALLRRVAYNTDVIRRVLIATLVIVPIIVTVLGIIALVMLHGLTPTPATTF
ncbi:MAG TPA: hypothetical protein VHZ97_04410 [Pseudonocardiaceae bacterium]|nr:hypothetical protein [Pseudonocardiaceae bacterium]